MPPTIVLLLFYALSIFLLDQCVQCLRRYRRRKLLILEHVCRSPPFLRQRDPILGLDTILQSYSALKECSYLHLSQRRFEEAGSTFQFSQFGTTVINTVEPKNIQEVLSKSFDDYSVGQLRAVSWHAILGKGILTADSGEWSRMRHSIRPMFSKGYIDDVSMFEGHVRHLLTQITYEERSIDLQDLFMDLTTAITSEFLFDSYAGAEQASYELRRFRQAFSRVQKAIARASPLGQLSRLVFIASRPIRQDRKTIRSFLDHRLKQSIGICSDGTSATGKTRSPPTYTMNSVTSAHDPPLPDRGDLSHLMLAGRDATAALLSNLFHLLVRHPSVLSRIQTEISTDLAALTDLPTASDLTSLPYLRHCLNETLRLFPPIPVNYRTATRDSILPLGGDADGMSPILVRKGWRVGYHTYTLHRSRSIYGSDADEFIAERWERKDLRPGWSFLPFSGGPRVCLGRGLALKVVSYVAVRLLQGVQVLQLYPSSGNHNNQSLTSGTEEWVEDVGLTCVNRTGCWVNVRRKNKAELAPGLPGEGGD